MKPSTLIEIKQQLLKLLPIVEAYPTPNANENLCTTLSVCLHNMCFDSIGCFGYSFEKELAEFNANHAFLMKIKDSEFSFHFIDWAIGEIDMIIEGYVINEYC